MESAIFFKPIQEFWGPLSCAIEFCFVERNAIFFCYCKISSLMRYYLASLFCFASKANIATLRTLLDTSAKALMIAGLPIGNLEEKIHCFVPFFPFLWAANEKLMFTSFTAYIAHNIKIRLLFFYWTTTDDKMLICYYHLERKKILIWNTCIMCW